MFSAASLMPRVGAAFALYLLSCHFQQTRAAVGIVARLPVRVGYPFLQPQLLI
jgi:hypothetical protein